VVRNASAIRRGCDVGRRTRDARGRSATTPAKSRSGGEDPAHADTVADRLVVDGTYSHTSLIVSAQ
jgi:hypothetical protein